MKDWKFALVPVLALLAGCSPISVKYDFDPAASFASLKSFDWYAASPRAKGKADGVVDPIMDRRVRRIVERELAARGFRLQTSGDPDFLLTYYPVYRDRVVQTYTGVGPAWGYGYRPWGYGWNAGFASGFQEVQRFREGSIVLEVVDNRTNQMIWQAVADGALTGIRDPADAEEQVTQAVRLMLAKFPPPAPKG
jgi:hypothetical protein